MTTNGSADDLLGDMQSQAEGPERKVDDTPAHFERYEPSPEDARRRDIVHYGPGNQPLCGDEDELALHTQDPHQVAGCEDCRELALEDLQDPHTRYGGYCLPLPPGNHRNRLRRVAPGGPAPMPATADDLAGDESTTTTRWNAGIMK